MTKAFLVRFKQSGISSSPIVWASQSGSCSINPFSIQPRDDRPILIIAKTIDEAADKFKNASEIVELDVRDIIIDERVDIIFKKE